MTIGVLDEFRKMNIGSNLLKYIYNKAVEIDGCIGVYLHVIYYNEAATKFYQKNKFKKVNKIDNYYFFNGKYYDSYVFFRIISKNEKEEFKKRIINSNSVIEGNKSYVNYIYNKVYIIKIIFLIICYIFNFLSIKN